VTVHGDLHLGQVFLDPGAPDRVTGVIDIDTAGLGDPADDAAALVAQLLASAELLDRAGSHARANATRRAADAFRAGWHRDGDPGFAGRARAIVAAHVLGHALSGSIDAGTALRLAGESLDESTLTSTSRPSHPRSAV
jgi:aminoglycoside phosphotransferase (APT) family kinase protein